MDAFEKQLSGLMLRSYNSLEKLELQMLRVSKSINLSMSELRLLQAVAAHGEDEGANISELSEALEISLPSVTAAVNKLVTKGYVHKEKSPGDGRVVRVVLTREGRRAERVQRYYHRRMVRELATELSDAEREAIIKGVTKLEDFLNRHLERYKKEPD